jgi:hypothetical protein
MKVKNKFDFMREGSYMHARFVQFLQDAAATIEPPRASAPKDSAADQGAPLTTTPLPQPLDNRATPPASTPRGPETAPLDTAQSGWEAALTERINSIESLAQLVRRYAALVDDSGAP